MGHAGCHYCALQIHSEWEPNKDPKGAQRRQGDSVSPFLFVLVMKYKHRKLMLLRSQPNYNFHPICEKVGIMSLSFADDVFLFTRGDSILFQMMISHIAEFSEATGLKINKIKSSVFWWCDGRRGAERNPSNDGV